MNYIDICIAIPLLWGAYKGFKKGLVIEAASIIALCLGIYGAIKFSEFTSGLLADNFDIKSDYVPIIAFALTFVLIVILVHLIAKMIDKFVSAVALGLLNRVMGITFGVLKFAFIISILLVVINKFDKKQIVISQEKKETSFLYKPLYVLAPSVYPSLKEFYNKHTGKY